MKQKVNSLDQADGGDILKASIASELVHRAVLITPSRESNLAIRSLRFVAGRLEISGRMAYPVIRLSDQGGHSPQFPKPE